MAELLLVVTGAFAVRGRAVEVLPTVPADRLPNPPFELTLRVPGGSPRRVSATAIVAHVRGSLPPMAMLRVNDVTEEDVPVGTEVWTD